MITQPLHWIVLTGVPFENSGGAQRAAQISKTLLNYGHKVTYIYASDYREKESSNIKIPLNNFATYHIKKFNIYNFIRRINKDKKLIVLIEVPYPTFLPIVQILKRYSFKIIYELIDPWDTELGKPWYNKSIEYRIIKLADILTATAKSLQEDLIKKSNRHVYLIPNAYNKDLFIKKNYKRPTDLPDPPILGYTGALWGSWFDIELIIEIAKTYQNHNIVLIGEYLKQFNPFITSNIHFLGLKPQTDLPSYLAYFDIGLIPFKVNKLTERVNPLKIYEYLAMELPVVASYTPELEGIPNVYLAKNKEEFTNKIHIALKNKNDFKKVKLWLENNNWENRVDKLINLIYIKKAR